MPATVRQTSLTRGNGAVNMASFPPETSVVLVAAGVLHARRIVQPPDRAGRGTRSGALVPTRGFRPDRAMHDGRSPPLQASTDRPLSVRAWSEPAFCVCAQAPVGFKQTLPAGAAFLR